MAHSVVPLAAITVRNSSLQYISSENGRYNSGKMQQCGKRLTSVWIIVIGHFPEQPSLGRVAVVFLRLYFAVVFAVAVFAAVFVCSFVHDNCFNAIIINDLK